MTTLCKIVVLLDTSKTGEIGAGIRIDDDEIWKREHVSRQKAQRILPLLIELLAYHQLRWVDISSIEIYPGPGSFTGLRVGFSVANALGFILQIPVNGGHAEAHVSPKYAPD